MSWFRVQLICPELPWNYPSSWSQHTSRNCHTSRFFLEIRSLYNCWLSQSHNLTTLQPHRFAILGILHLKHLLIQLFILQTQISWPPIATPVSHPIGLTVTSYHIRILKYYSQIHPTKPQGNVITGNNENITLGLYGNYDPRRNDVIELQHLDGSIDKSPDLKIKRWKKLWHITHN